MDSDRFSLTDFVSLRSEDLFSKVHAFNECISDFGKKGYEDAYLRQIIKAGSSRVSILDGDKAKEVIIMCSANYLGLANHPRLIAASKDALDKYGASVSSVPLIAGSTDLHKKLEKELSLFKKTENAILFPTGYAANTGVITALTSFNDWVVVDKMVHYSIIDGVRAARAKMISFRHNDDEHLKEILENIRKKENKCGILVVIEGVYGIDGDLPPVNDIVRIAHQYDARVMVDECHATGVVGKFGEGIISQVRENTMPDIIMDSLSKALGSMGGWIGSSHEVTKYLRYYSKPVSFSVGLPTVSVAAALAGLNEIKSNPGLVKKCQENSEFVKFLLSDLGFDNVRKSNSAIMSIVIGDELKLRKITKELLDNNVWVEGIPFPAVPRGQERIRIRVQASHTKDDLKEVVSTIDKVLTKHRAGKVKVLGTTLVKAVNVHPSTDVIIAESNGQLMEVAQFLWNIESESAQGVAWYRIEDKVEFLSGSFSYHKNNVQITVFFVKEAGKIIATASAFIDQKAFANHSERVGYIGCVGFLPEHETSATKVIQQVCDHLSEQGIKVVLGPVDVPMFIFGGGITDINKRGVVPFFQPYYPSFYKNIFKKSGFVCNKTFSYYLFDLSCVADNILDHFDGDKIIVREINKLDLLNEATVVCDLLNECFSSQYLFYGITKDEFIDMARIFLDIIYPDLWMIAEVDGKPAGFISAFPLCEEAFRLAKGNWGLVDLEEIRHRLMMASKGSIAWLAVSDKFKGHYVGKKLLGKLLLNMKKRGYSSATMTWEISDPDFERENLVLEMGGIRADYDLQIYSHRRTL